jgi:hypothetical protein
LLSEFTCEPNYSEENNKGTQQIPEVQAEVEVIIEDNFPECCFRLQKIINVFANVKYNGNNYKGSNHE